MKILTLSTYPIGTPAHGGQHRLSNIVRSLREAGHEVQAAGVLGSDQYAAEEYFCEYPGHAQMGRYIRNPLLMEDWAIGKLYADDDDAYRQLAAHIDPAPDLIFVENPWLFDFAKRYVLENRLTETKLFYGSENIEHRLRYEIALKYLSVEEAETARRLILETELVTLRNADGVCAVSRDDLAWVQSHTSAKCVLAQNGVARRVTTDEGIEQANRIIQHRKAAILCASAHPPNISGFYDMFAGGMGCFAPDESLVLVGGIGPLIAADSRFARTAGLSRSVIAAGVVSDACLQGLLTVAHAVILPITHGGGTNLKTAEALWAGRHVVTTSVALRGFESFRDARGVNVADDSGAFLSSLRNVMAAAPLQLSREEQSRRTSVLWDDTLTDLVAAIGDFDRSSNGESASKRQLHALK
ncbi:MULTISPECIES: glycosyltransferase [unclassified Burkholderia]|uniref:glycosyltransferase n=1 Tax=unclassified Burkholderia TaxID=2613784 RepID=UPI0004698A91|nr:MULTISPECIES: glycosyltransferase [unclassified Burkholderia]NIF70256.1 glycosyltransferase [Burkholderia sp. Ap-962]